MVLNGGLAGEQPVPALSRWSLGSDLWLNHRLPPHLMAGIMRSQGWVGSGAMACSPGQPNRWQEEGKEIARLRESCHICQGPCNSTCVSAGRLQFSKGLVALGILPAWSIKVCPCIFLPACFPDGVRWQERRWSADKSLVLNVIYFSYTFTSGLICT